MVAVVRTVRTVMMVMMLMMMMMMMVMMMMMLTMIDDKGLHWPCQESEVEVNDELRKYPNMHFLV